MGGRALKTGVIVRVRTCLRLRRRASLGLVVCVCAALGAASCSSTSVSRRSPSRQAAGLVQGTDPQALRADLANFVDLYSAVIAGAMGEIAAETQDRRAREYAFLVRGRLIPRARAALLDEDPREALVNIWAQVVYIRYWMARGSYALVFPDFAPMLEEATATLDQAIVELALRHFPEEAVLETRECLETTVRSLTPGSDLNPRTEIAAAARTSDGNPLAILFVPLRPLAEVGDAAESIARMSQVVQSSLQFVKELPLMMRWQAEMLLFELDDMETMVALREESRRLSVQLASLNETASQAPQRIREETEILLRSTDAAAARLDRTLIESQRVAEQVNAALVQAERVSDSLASTSASVGSTMEATRGLMGDIERLRTPRPGASGESSSFDLSELARLAESLERAASETRALLADAGKPLAPDSGVNRTIDRASLELNGLLNGLLWRGAALIGMAFVAALAFHAITRVRRPASA